MAKALKDLGLRDVEAIRRRAKRDCFEGRIQNSDLIEIESLLDSLTEAIEHSLPNTKKES
jgi:hypothetical protein